MKALPKSLKILGLFTLALVACLSPAQAQQKQGETKMTIRVTEEKNGLPTETVKAYQLPAMDETQRQEFIKQVLDSLDQDIDKQVVTVVVEEVNNRNKSIEDRRELHVKRRIDRPEDEDSFAYHWENIEKDLERASGDLESKMKHFEKSFSPKSKAMMRDIENWGDRFGDRIGDFWDNEVTKPSSIKGLNVFTNKPHDGLLNVRFKALESGDVNIRVTDTRGKEVGEKNLKDFQGEFVGQVELKKQAQGTLFVTVTLHEDGSVLRVVLP